jgi:AcrR family transcriptional regulator
MNQPRTYTMRARAAAVEQTRARIIDAAYELCSEQLLSEVGLDAIARRAGVSVQTVLRQFGSRAGLVEATTEHVSALVAAERQAPPGDVTKALRVLIDHYELRGDATVLLLAQERADPVVGAVVARGRQLHRTWVADVFGPLLAGLPEVRREAALDLLHLATDVYSWKILRRDRGLDRDTVEERMTTMTEAALSAVTERLTDELTERRYP